LPVIAGAEIRKRICLAGHYGLHAIRSSKTKCNCNM